MSPCEPENLLVVDIADNHERGIVRAVPVAIPAARVSRTHLLQIAHPAYDRTPIRVRLERGRHELFVHQRTRLILGAQTPFFHDHFQFLAELLLTNDQIRHAIRLQGHHRSQRLAWDLLKIGGVIQAGEGIVAPPRIGDPLVEFADLQLSGLLEHHVLQHMRYPRSAIDLVHGAGPVPDHMHHGRRAVILPDHHFQAVGQSGFEGIRCGRSQRTEQGDDDDMSN